MFGFIPPGINPYLNHFKAQRDRATPEVREHLVRLFSHAVPNDEAIQAIGELQLPVLEIGAGSGYWAALIARAGVPVRAVEPAKWSHYWAPVHEGDYKEVADPEYAAVALMLCWPPEGDIASRCLHMYSGKRVIYIGEPQGGQCADDRFFLMLEEWALIKEVAIPQWPGCNDRLQIYGR